MNRTAADRYYVAEATRRRRRILVTVGYTVCYWIINV